MKTSFDFTSDMTFGNIILNQRSFFPTTSLMGPATVSLEGNFLVEAFHLGTLSGPSLNSIEMLGKFLCRELGLFFHESTAWTL